MSNMDLDGSTLVPPAGDMILAYVDFTVAVIYILILTIWAWHVSKVWCKTVSPPFFQILLTVALPLLSATFATSGAALLQLQVQGSRLSLDLALDILIIAASVTLLTAFVTGLERVDSYLTSIERGVLYVAVLIWMLCQTVLALCQHTAGVLSLLVPPDSETWPRTAEVLWVARLVALALFALLLASEFTALACTLLLRKPKDRHRDDREDEGPFSKFYVHVLLFIMFASLYTTVLPLALPSHLSWLTKALDHVVLCAFLGYTLFWVRPSLERSLYQLFDENDDLDAELDEI